MEEQRRRAKISSTEVHRGRGTRGGGWHIHTHAIALVSKDYDDAKRWGEVVKAAWLNLEPECGHDAQYSYVIG